jgi:hypothetical protein
MSRVYAVEAAADAVSVEAKRAPFQAMQALKAQ